MATRRAPRATRAAPGSGGRDPRRVRRLGIGGVALALALGCGGDEPSVPPDPGGSSQSVPGEQSGLAIEALSFRPEAPSAGDEIELVIEARAPGGNPLTTHVAWYVNDALQREGARPRFDTAGLRWGDKIHAVVQVSDGTAEEERTSPVLVLGNARPRVLELRFLPPVPLGTQATTVQATVEDAEGEPVTMSYEWWLDGERLADVSGPTLEAGRLRRQQRLRVRAAASDARGAGTWAESGEIVVGNAQPLIRSEPVLELSGPRQYEYAVQASDPDGDRPLRYQLVEGPDGMEIDLVSGQLSWHVPSDADGSIPVEIQVSDPHGGSVRQRWELLIEWETVAPASQDSQ